MMTRGATEIIILDSGSGLYQPEKLSKRDSWQK
jgi:hypothetical protein